MFTSFVAGDLAPYSEFVFCDIVRFSYLYYGRFRGQKMLLAKNFDGESILQKKWKQFGPLGRKQERKSR